MHTVGVVVLIARVRFRAVPGTGCGGPIPPPPINAGIPDEKGN